ncbi:MAG: hypothetical protein HFJ58_00025 [Clostridia bacterium]|nr:hypothetical protein [Clostridia bacterium]
MSFIGVICDSKNENYIKQILRENLKNKTVIILKEDNVENFKNIKFETVVIMSNEKTTNLNQLKLSEKNVIKKIVDSAKYLVVNADEEINLNLLQETNGKVITYGFNSKSTVTASSVKEDGVLLCVQRNIENLEGKNIELQEFNINKINTKIPTNIVMGLATALLMYGIEELNI